MKRFLISFALAGALVMSQTPQQSAQAADDGTIGTIIGAVGGGLLGSTVGKGKGRIVATAAGTVIGAVLGHEVATQNDRYDYEDDVYDRPRPRVIERRIVYREVPVREKVVVVKERDPKHKKWQRVGAYDGDVLVCNKKGKRCHWYQ